MKTTLRVSGMHCKGCKALIEDELEELGAEEAVVTLDEADQRGTVTFSHKEPERVIEAIEALGDYTVERR